MRIGTLAEQTEISVETIRYYEQRGLLRSPERTPGGHRSYNSTDARTLLTVRALVDLRMSLDEVRQFLEATGRPQEEPLFLERLSSRAADHARKAKALKALHGQCRRGAPFAEVLSALANSVSNDHMRKQS